MSTSNMAEMKNHCAHDELAPSKGKGRTASYLGYRNLPLPEELVLPTCVSCGRWFVNKHVAAAYDEALKTAYRAALASQVKTALMTLKKHGVSQEQLETLLDLSSGYLSKIRNGKKTPSMALVIQLSQFATMPRLVSQVDYFKEAGCEKRLEQPHEMRIVMGARLDEDAAIETAVPVPASAVTKHRSETLVKQTDSLTATTVLEFVS